MREMRYVKLLLPLLMAFSLASCDIHDTHRRGLDDTSRGTNPLNPYYGLIGQAFSDKYDGVLTELYDVLEFDPDLREQEVETTGFSSIEEERRYWHGTRRDYEELFNEEHKRWEVSYVRDVERTGFRKLSDVNLEYQFRSAHQDTIRDPYARNVYKADIQGTRQGAANDREFNREADLTLEGLNDHVYTIKGEHVSVGERTGRGRPGSEIDERYEIKFRAYDTYINTRIPENLLYQVKGRWNVIVRIETNRGNTVTEYTGRMELDGSGYAYLRMDRDRFTVRYDLLTGQRR